MKKVRAAVYLGTHTGVKKAVQIGPEVSCRCVAKEVVLGLAAAAGVDVGLDAHAAPVHQHVWDVPEQLCFDAPAPEALAPYVTLHETLLSCDAILLSLCLAVQLPKNWVIIRFASGASK